MLGERLRQPEDRERKGPDMTVKPRWFKTLLAPNNLRRLRDEIAGDGPSHRAGLYLHEILDRIQTLAGEIYVASGAELDPSRAFERAVDFYVYSRWLEEDVWPALEASLDETDGT